MEMSDYLFVYGTLAPDKAPASISDAVRKLVFVAPGSVEGRLYDLGNYPGVKLSSKKKNKIRGRVYRLPSDPSVLEKLDAYEEYYPSAPNDSLYLRKLADVELSNGRTLRAWVYEYNGDPGVASPHSHDNLALSE
jgi:gamma-glutamylcyclotransferase (GGCT)/AIG2-like uncharacterized protein YtfP